MNTHVYIYHCLLVLSLTYFLSLCVPRYCEYDQGKLYDFYGCALIYYDC